MNSKQVAEMDVDDYEMIEGAVEGLHIEERVEHSLDNSTYYYTVWFCVNKQEIRIKTMDRGLAKKIVDDNFMVLAAYKTDQYYDAICWYNLNTNYCDDCEFPKSKLLKVIGGFGKAVLALILTWFVFVILPAIIFVIIAAIISAPLLLPGVVLFGSLLFLSEYRNRKCQKKLTILRSRMMDRVVDIVLEKLNVRCLK